MKRAKHAQGGFTLVEISLAMSIFTFMLLVVSMAYINIARLYNASTAARNVQQNNRFAMEQMSRVARSSKAVTLSAANPDGGVKGLCFVSSSGSQYFYLESVGGDPKKNELRQSKVASCVNPVPQSPKVLSSTEAYAARLEADATSSGTVTMSLWMVSKVDLLNTGDATGLSCKAGSRSEFCAINKLTTTVVLRGE